jgi:hypothetical protein
VNAASGGFFHTLVRQNDITPGFDDGIENRAQREEKIRTPAPGSEALLGL